MVICDVVGVAAGAEVGAGADTCALLVGTVALLTAELDDGADEDATALLLPPAEVLETEMPDLGLVALVEVLLTAMVLFSGSEEVLNGAFVVPLVGCAEVALTGTPVVRPVPVIVEFNGTEAVGTPVLVPFNGTAMLVLFIETEVLVPFIGTAILVLFNGSTELVLLSGSAELVMFMELVGSADLVVLLVACKSLFI